MFYLRIAPHLFFFILVLIIRFNNLKNSLKVLIEEIYLLEEGK